MLMTTFAPKCITRLITALSANGTAVWTAKEPGLSLLVAAKGRPGGQIVVFGPGLANEEYRIFKFS